MVSVFVPILYLAVLIGGLSTFSYFYRRRKNAPVSQIDEWFPPNTARDVYFSLQAQEGIPDAILKAALLVRAVEDIKRLQKLQTRKQALHNLMQRGGAGDDLWKRFLQLEEEMKDEIMDVAQEATALQEGWNQVIFQTANEMYLNDLARQKLSKILPKAQELKKELTENADTFKARSLQVQENAKKRIEGEKTAAEAQKVADLKAAEEVRAKAAKELLEMEERERQQGKGGKSKSGSPKSKRK